MNGEQVLIKSADLEQLRCDIAAAVVESMLPMINSSDLRLVDRHQMAERLNVSVATIDRLTSDESIPSVLVKNRRRYHPGKVIEALENQDRE